MAQPALSDASTSQTHLASLQQLLQCPGEYARSTPLQLAPSADGTVAPTLSMMSLNVLGRVYTTSARRFVGHPAPEFISWDWRRARIQEIMLAASPDIICCQEIVQAEFESLELRQAAQAREAERLAAAQAKEAALKAKKEEMQKKAEKKAAAAAARKAASGAAAVSAPAPVAAADSAVAAPAAASPEPDAASVASASPAPAAAAAVSADDVAAADAAAAAAGADSDDGEAPANSTANLRSSYEPPVEGDFSTFLTRNGYSYALQAPAQKADKYPVGVGVFWKNSRFYPKPVVYDSRSRAIIVALKLRTSEDKEGEEPVASLDNTVFVCNVHLQGHFEEVAMRLNQVKSMFKQLSIHVAMVAKGASKAAASAASSSSSSAAADAAPTASAAADPSPMVVFTGDFNQNFEHSSVHLLAVRGTVPAGYMDATVGGRVVTKEAVAQPYRMESAYDPCRRPARFWPAFTFHNGHNHQEPSYSNVLDYVYHTPSTLPLLATMRVIGGEEELRVIERDSIPNELIPSDHLPIGATFYCPALDKKRART